MFDTPQHCGRVWSMSVSILKCTSTWRLSISFFFSFFRALQYTYLYPVKTEQMSGCLMCWNIKRTLFVRAWLGFVCFICDACVAAKPGGKHSWLRRSVFLSSCAFEKPNRRNHARPHNLVPFLLPASARLMNTLGACGEMKDLIHQAPVPRSLLTTCAINFTNEQCHVGFQQKTNKTLY